EEIACGLLGIGSQPGDDPRDGNSRGRGACRPYKARNAVTIVQVGGGADDPEPSIRAQARETLGDDSRGSGAVGGVELRPRGAGHAGGCEGEEAGEEEYAAREHQPSSGSTAAAFQTATTYPREGGFAREMITASEHP